ncbi:cobalt-precorrin-5B (C(1))-methyltransferase [Rubellimicrobium roseum]|uniref:Cobalt-precorrin-5B C(1)-methyltransferase n=1 Tax=Rubellimicrobium roseum TaxID=687525 RepID=A0A5C4N867_9RHOB|nr:cobalt-precorrin-5B (C(1))-methyltransferase [Rubellimicrobium roseum]TNC68028.1 cobalt-precorrin-5B (C(1))-methyltransferase [Rubellimicrobium roseum]
MTDSAPTPLRRGWTTGACATAATRAALLRLWGGAFPDSVTITLPRGEMPTFVLAHCDAGEGWAEAGIVKDAGDDPDVTHGALIVARVAPSAGGVTFCAGPGVGTVTRPGLPIPPGEPAINPVPRAMMDEQVADLAAEFGRAPDIEITVSIPGGEEIAQRTWNPRLGIEGGLSVLGTTGIVRPFSCAAWIASIHRGIDVARASGIPHVAGCTGATSEAAVRALHGLPEIAMIDMGDFAGGMLKYLRRHPVPRVTLGGGFAKIAKFAQGAQDLHSGRSQLDMGALARLAGDPRVAEAPTGMAALTLLGPPLADRVARAARDRLDAMLDGTGTVSDVVITDRAGSVVGRAGP